MATDILHPFPYIRWVYRHSVAFTGRTIDRALGVSTTFAAPPGPWQAFDFTSLYSRPFGWMNFFRVFRTLKIGPDDVFLDIGAGTGRATICASLLPFRRVIGVEIDPEIHEQARRNAESLRSRHRTKITFVRADARSYAIPDDVTVIFMYNPFGGEIFAQVMANIFASLDRAPRRLRLVYSYPKEQQQLERTGRCRLVDAFRGMRPGSDWAFMLSTKVYELEPAPSSQAAPREAVVRVTSGGGLSGPLLEAAPR